MNSDEDINNIIEDAKARTDVFFPRCMKCNSDLTDKEYFTKKCKDCGYNSNISVQHCIRLHFKGLPEDLIKTMVEGFKVE